MEQCVRVVSSLCGITPDPHEPEYFRCYLGIPKSGERKRNATSSTTTHPSRIRESTDARRRKQREYNAKRFAAETAKDTAVRARCGRKLKGARAAEDGMGVVDCEYGCGQSFAYPAGDKEERKRALANRRQHEKRHREKEQKQQKEQPPLPAPLSRS